MEEACVVCGSESANHIEESLYLCQQCGRTVPSTLIHADTRVGQYVVRMRSGDMFSFKSATLHGQWVLLERGFWMNVKGLEDVGYSVQTDVRISDIEWCTDMENRVF